MSIPRPDPNFTMEMLEEELALFLAAGRRYWEAAHKAGIGGAIIWGADSNDGLVLFTRGEYKSQILYNIPMLGKAVEFGAVKKVDE